MTTTQRDEHAVNTTPRDLTDAEIDEIIAHYESKEYAAESGGAWKPRAAFLELRRLRVATALSDSDRAYLTGLRDEEVCNAAEASIDDRKGDEKCARENAALFNRLLALGHPR